MKFKENPFWLLDASPRDSKRVLHDKAEDKSFELPEDVCRNAENILITPKKRLEAELAWFPGLSPGKTEEFLVLTGDSAERGIYVPEDFEEFEGLSYANALAFFISNVSANKFDKWSLEEVVDDFCFATSNIDEQETLRLINEDRAASGITEITDEDFFDQEMQNLMRFYKQILHDFLNAFDSNIIIGVLTSLIEEETDKGEHECDYPLLDDVISDYEVEVTPFFDKQEEKIDANIHVLTTLMQSFASCREIDARVKILIELDAEFIKLKDNVLAWDKVAQPIQVLCKSKGIDHKRSFELYSQLRGLALKAQNDCDLTTLSIEITELQQSVFEELRRASEIARDDKNELQSIAREKSEARANLIKYINHINSTPIRTVPKSSGDGCLIGFIFLPISALFALIKSFTC